MSIASRAHRGTARRVRSALFTAIASVAMLLAAGGVAAASPAAPLQEPDCPFSSLCLYDGTDFAGERFTVSSFDPSGTCVSLVDYGWGDRARSVANTHTNYAAMFMNDDCLGDPFPVPGGSSRADLGAFTPKSVWVPAS